MRNDTFLKRTESIRFRRWSRAGYAIFRSLSHCVTIGSVCVSICDMSFQKSSSFSLKTTDNKLSDNETEDEESEKIKDNTSQALLEQLVILSTLVKPAAASAVSSVSTNLNIYKPAVEIS